MIDWFNNLYPFPLGLDMLLVAGIVFCYKQIKEIKEKEIKSQIKRGESLG